MTEIMSDQRQRFAPEVTPFSPWGIRLYGHPPINTWNIFINGAIEVQDEGSQLLALLVEPKRGEMVIDFCAGAGGKSLAMAAMMKTTGRLYAFDISAGRLARAKPRFARSGLSNVHPVVIRNENDDRVKRLAGKAHRVLVDAPCTGVGTLRRNPDLKWRYPESGLVEICAQQRRILDRASQCVRPGGRLVYATCSFLPEENEHQVQAFLERNPNFELNDASTILNQHANLVVEGPMVHLRPDQHQTDAFFAAVMTRKAASAKPAPSAKFKADTETKPETEIETEASSTHTAVTIVDSKNQAEPQAEGLLELEAADPSMSQLEVLPGTKPKTKTEAKAKTKTKTEAKAKTKAKTEAEVQTEPEPKTDTDRLVDVAPTVKVKSKLSTRATKKVKD
jgi:16S rRNA (cytosine967-C5)-methyltransferase